MATLEHTPYGRGYERSFGYFNHDNDYWTETLWAHLNDTGEVNQCKGNSTRAPIIIDMWRAGEVNDTYTASTGRGAVGENGSSPVSEESWIPKGVNGTVENYEETKFAKFVLEVIAEHDVSDRAHPLFVNYVSGISKVYPCQDLMPASNACF
jgi:hypothetical protein